MISTRIHLVLHLLMMASLLVACQQDSPPIAAPSPFGRLQIIISGLPAGVEASVSISSDGRFSTDVSASRIVDNLAPGLYTLNPRPILVNNLGRRFSAAPQTVLVSAGRTTRVEIDYRSESSSGGVERGRLEINVNGLPASVAANATLRNAEGFSENISGSITIAELEVGRYTLEAAAVSDDANPFRRYLPAQASQSIDIVANTTRRVDLNYDIERGSLRVTVSGVPAGSSVDINIRGPAEFSSQGRSSFVIADMLPGTYTITPSEVIDNEGRRYSSPPRQVLIRSGERTEESILYSLSSASAEIRGTVWYDRAASGRRDSGDDGLKGFVVFLDTNNNGILDANEPAVVTDSSGRYHFRNLPPGQIYTVSQYLPLGWSNTVADRPRLSQIAPRIVGGDVAFRRDFPFMVALVDAGQSDNLRAQFCGGSLLADRWVVTAGHCVDGSRNSSNVEVLVATDNLQQGGERQRVRRVLYHPNYQGSPAYDYDIALLELETPLLLPRLPLLRSSQGDLASPGTLGRVLGWGSSFFGGSSSPQLQQVDVPIISNQRCREIYGNRVTNAMLCAGFPQGGADACSGDSGGPMLVRDSQGLWRNVGIVSWGEDCARAEFPGVYSRVSVLSDWVVNTVPRERSGSHRVDLRSAMRADGIDFGNFR